MTVDDRSQYGPRLCATPLRIAIIADDLTGAADAAAAFKVWGFSTVIALTTAAQPDAAVVARFSGGRDRSEATAIRLTRSAVAALREGPIPQIWYHKIDSVLRGHPAAELAVMMEILGLKRALVVPALPSEGRIVVDGEVFVDRRPLGDSQFATGQHEPIAERLRHTVTVPVTSLTAPELDAGYASVAARLVALQYGVVVADARDDADLARLARAALASTPLLLCGSAGLASAVAAAIAAPTLTDLAAGLVPLPSTTRPVLVVAGSQHPATGRQIERLAADGAAIVRPDRLIVETNDADDDALNRKVTHHLVTGRTTVLTSLACPRVELGGAAIAGRLARIAATSEILAAMGGIIATGGEAAAALFRATGATMLQLGGEVQPAVPWGVLMDGAASDLPVVTKAGSFGDDDTLCRGVAFLQGAGETKTMRPLDGGSSSPAPGSDESLSSLRREQ